MEMIKVTFPDGSVHEFEKGVKILDVAISISEGFARNVIGAVVNDDIIKGLSETLKEDCTVKFVKFEDKEGKEIFWHTSSHVMALAIQRLFPDTKFGIGPAIENFCEKNTASINPIVNCTTRHAIVNTIVFLKTS